MPKEETRIVKQILEKLKERFPDCYLRKIHGNPFQHAGIPDIIGCVLGHFIGLEVKTDSGRVSKIQELEGLSILQADGIHGVVTSAEEAISIIEKGILARKVRMGQNTGLG